MVPRGSPGRELPQPPSGVPAAAGALNERGRISSGETGRSPFMGQPTYPATAESATDATDRRHGLIVFGKEELVFDSEPVFDTTGALQTPGLTIAFPLVGLHVRLTLGDESGLRFVHPDYPGWTVVTYDQRGIRAARTRVPFAEVSADRKPTRNTSPIIPFILLAAATIASLIFVVDAVRFTHDMLVRGVLMLVPASVERQLGEIVLAGMRSSLVRDEQSLADLREVASPLIEHARDDGHDIRLELAYDESLNAASLPGDIIVVNTGLVRGVGDERELLGVLAHELAHAMERHSLKQMTTTIGLSVALSFVVGNLDALTAEAARLAPYLLSQSYARSQEEEADRIAVTILRDSGLDPSGLVHFLERMNEIAPDDGSIVGRAAERFLSTHPVTSDRIELLRELIGEPPADHPSPTPAFERLRESLKDLADANRLPR